MGTCEDRDGLHIYKGKAVYAVPGYPQECMECGASIPLSPRYRDAMPPYDPIDWTAENEHAFLNGVFKVEKMTREEFAARYPGV